MAYVNPRVAAFSQYLMSDDPPRSSGYRYGGFESGLRTADGKEKPAYKGFRLPLAVEATGQPTCCGGSCARSARRPGDDRVQAARAASGGRCKTLTTTRTGVYALKTRTASGQTTACAGRPRRQDTRVRVQGYQFGDRLIRVPTRYGRIRRAPMLEHADAMDTMECAGPAGQRRDRRPRSARSSTPTPSTAARWRWSSCASTARSAASACSPSRTCGSTASGCATPFARWQVEDSPALTDGRHAAEDPYRARSHWRFEEPATSYAAA